ncbi:MAG TPA: SGNH/GDSL hydrolase family protein [Sphingomicrobium sp.]|nr:SGNH/GDSL hydrolase family protein [Sphingomicrobium sp.]
MKQLAWRDVRMALAMSSLVGFASANAQTVTPVEAPPTPLVAIRTVAVGRVEREPNGMLRRQWPGTYFETAIRGSSAYFRMGKGEVSLRVTVDGAAPVPLVKPAPGLYRIGGLAPGVHRVRVQVASESQNGPTEFGGFFAPAGVSAAVLPARSRQIEFIGDSHTVGYANTSSKHQCTDEEIWQTTDTTVGVPALTAAHYDADYQVNAISGRGIVRNYNGFAADTLPQAYPYMLFDKAQPYRDPNWHPQLIVVSLGTNDFSTPLNPGEKWSNRQQLQSDYESTFVRFLTGLHARNPRARFLLWAATPSPELNSEIEKVVQDMRSAGGTQIDYVPVRGLAMSACNWHPSAADDAKIASALERDIDLHPELWANRGERG